MPRQYNIKWRDTDTEELRKAIKNFNAKITRLEKKYPKNKNILPEKVSMKELKSLIDTRQDLKREINSLKRFTKRGSEEIVQVPGTDYNLKTTKWQKEEMNRRIGVINRRRKQRLQDLQEIPQTSRGTSLGYTKRDIGMGKAEEISLTPMKAFTQKMNQKDLKFKFKNIMKESQSTYWDKADVRLRENYIQSLLNNFNPKDVNKVIDKIRNMDLKDFKKVYYEEGGTFEFNYPPNEEEYKKMVTYQNSLWLPKQRGA